MDGSSFSAKRDPTPAESRGSIPACRGAHPLKASASRPQLPRSCAPGGIEQLALNLPSPAGSILGTVSREGSATIIRLDRATDAVDATPPEPIQLQPIELPRSRRPGWPTLAALAIATGLVAIGLGAWSVFSEARSRPTAGEDAEVERSLAVLADSSAVRYPLRGSVGRVALVVTESDDAVLALDGLGPAPVGSTYRVWLVAPGSATPVGDAAFDAASPVVALERRIPSGTRVAVTLEPAADTTRPSRPLRLVAVRE